MLFRGYCDVWRDDDVLEVFLFFGKIRVKDVEKLVMKVEEEEERGSMLWYEIFLSMVEKIRFCFGIVSWEENVGLCE